MNKKHKEPSPSDLQKCGLGTPNSQIEMQFRLRNCYGKNRRFINAALNGILNSLVNRSLNRFLTRRLIRQKILTYDGKKHQVILQKLSSDSIVVCLRTRCWNSIKVRFTRKAILKSVVHAVIRNYVLSPDNVDVIFDVADRIIGYAVLVYDKEMQPNSMNLLLI